MKNVKRSVRRHHKYRLKKARKHYWGGHASSSDKLLSQCVETPCACSCWMCGHQRLHQGVTLQEKRIIAAQGDYQYRLEER